MSDSGSGQTKMGLNATWSMAVGGMVGGGIFSVLGVVLSVSGRWAWLSFVLAGLIALATGLSYVELTAKFHRGGGAFTFLRRFNFRGMAGSLAWLLILGYILTISVYAFTFAHYTNQLVHLGPWFVRFAAIAVVAVVVAVNLAGVGESAWFEIVTVWGKMAILLGLAGIGLWHWNPKMLSEGVEPAGMEGALLGAAVVFMAYEGFQLLAYDYADIRRPEHTLRIGIPLAIVSVILTYVVVALGATMLVGAGTLLEEREVALAVAGDAALGRLGVLAVSIAAAFSTGSAINATLFATARLMRDVAEERELPGVLAVEDKNGVPRRALLVIGGLGAVLAVTGTLHQLVESASLAFLITFGTVNLIAALGLSSYRRWIAWLGTLGAGSAAVALCVRLAVREPWVFVSFLVLVAIATLGRAALLHFRPPASAH